MKKKKKSKRSEKKPLKTIRTKRFHGWIKLICEMLYFRYFFYCFRLLNRFPIADRAHSRNGTNSVCVSVSKYRHWLLLSIRSHELFAIITQSIEICAKCRPHSIRTRNGGVAEGGRERVQSRLNAREIDSSRCRQWCKYFSISFLLKQQTRRSEIPNHECIYRIF